ncbi:hypothetical protein [Deinococcus sp.]|uniref:hypothetical protein n=1 Tax=Deinococcus sp. TaxID=47478 RepID=UPI003CC63776
MNRHLGVLIAAALTAADLNQGAAATDLRIYSSFAEVREAVTATGRAFRLALPQDAWNNMVPGTLDLEGLNFISAVQAQQADWLTQQEGKRVTLIENGKRVPVTLIRARDLLIRDAAGEYRTVAYAQLRFSVPPPLDPQAPTQSLTYALTRPGSGTVSYLTRGLVWSPRLTLKVSGDGAVLTALADLRNGTGLAYRVSATELVAGDVTIQDGATLQAASGNATAATPGAIPLPSVPTQGRLGTLGTLNGLYRYGLKTAYLLPASSTLTLPFLTPKLNRFQRYASLSSSFSPQDSQGTLNRSYRLKADQNLPGGPLTVREDGRISGQTSLQETAKGEQVEFTLGRDPDVRYVRSVQTLSASKKRGVYRVTYAFTSNKDRAVRVEADEYVTGRSVVLNGALPPRSNQLTVPLRLTLPAGGKASQTFTVTIDHT